MRNETSRLTDDEISRLEVSRSDREAFALCLALGTLEAMRGGAWPLTSGIWTLGRPVFWEPLLAALDDSVVEVFQQADELSTLGKLCGHSAAEETLDRMIALLRSRLAALPEKTWYAYWPEYARLVGQDEA